MAGTHSADRPAKAGRGQRKKKMNEEGQSLGEACIRGRLKGSFHTRKCFNHKHIQQSMPWSLAGF